MLATAESAGVLAPREAAGKKNCATAIVNDRTSVMLELSGVLLDKELKRLQEKQARFLSISAGLLALTERWT